MTFNATVKFDFYNGGYKINCFKIVAKKFRLSTFNRNIYDYKSIINSMLITERCKKIVIAQSKIRKWCYNNKLEKSLFWLVPIMNVGHNKLLWRPLYSLPTRT